MSNEFVARNGLISRDSAIVSGSLNITGSTSITGSANISGSSDVLNALATAGGSAPVFNVFGTAGQLFTVTDGLEGSLFSVNTISGLPIMEAFSTGRINLGSYSAPALIITGSKVSKIDYSGSLLLTGSILGTNTSYISIGTTSSVARINAYGTTNVVSIYGSTSEGVMFDVNGPSGQLFSVVDGLSGSLFSVNTISGLPIMEAFSNATIRMGNYGNPGLIVTGSSVVATGSFSGSFTGTFTGTSTTSSFADTASAVLPLVQPVLITGSLEVTGSSNLGALSASNAVVFGDVQVLGTASINTLVVNQTQLSTGSNQLGDAVNDTQTLFGSVIIPTGSLTVTGSITSSQNIQINSATFGIGSNVPTSQSLNIGWNNLTASAQEYYYGNIAVGVNNLQATNWGNYNVAIGISSLSSNTSGSRNIAIGSGPLNLNTIGDYNIGIGSAAMSQNKSGSHNIAMGFQSLLQMGIGSTLDSNYNVALGLASGVNFQTGSYNIFLGTQNNYILSGSNNTFIGSRLNSATFGAPTIGLNNTVIIADGTGSIRLYSPSSTNVIIGGTTDLGYKLQVSGSGNFNNDLTTSGSFTAGVSSIGRYWSPTTIFDTGSANNGLTVRGDLVVAHTNNLSQLVFGYTNSTKYLFVGTDGIGPYFKGTTVLDIRVVNGADVGLYVRSDNTAFFNSSNVSINGTTGLGEKTLQVNGSGRFTNTLSVTGSTDIRGAGSTSSTYGLSVVNSSGISSLYVSDNGNVGIGNTSPNYKLDVSGSSEFVGNMLVTGSITTSADSYFNTIRVGLGNNNVYRNTAIGAETGQFITSGDGNTVVGYRAGQFLSTGTGNIAIGTNSGNGLQTGTDNVILAINGATYLGAGSRNIILGVGANFNPSGNNNIVIGYQALHGGVGGHSNSVAVGYRALYATSAGNNVAVGYEAGSSNGGSSGMAALGYQALSGSTGANNTALGALAGFNNTSGANNIFIGYLATGSSATESNRTWIGNSSTTSTWLAGKVLIGTRNTSSAILDIYKSGSTVVDIQGSQGQLFSIVDSLSGSLMSVNDVSGLPILEVFSDDKVTMGTFGAPAMVITGSSAIVSGSMRGRVVTLSTASATASMDCSLSNFFNLVLSSSSTIHLSASNIQPGQTINLRVTQPATSGSLTYTTQFKFAGGIPYSASATGSAVDLVSFITFDSTNLYGSAIKNLS